MKTLKNEATISCIQSDQLAIKRVYEALTSLEQEYPHFKQWFFETTVPGVVAGTRKIFTASVSNKIAGVLIVKDADEKKICTLRVQQEYRRMGIGHQLMECAVQTLNTSKPLITVSDEHFDEFESLFAEFGFVAVAAYVGYYRKGHTEFAFNGYLNSSDNGIK